MRNILIILCLFFTQTYVSQSTTSLSVSESNEYKDAVKAKEIYSLRTTDDGKTGIVRKSKYNLLFDVFDSNLNKIYDHSEKISSKEKFAGELFSKDEIKFFTVFKPKKKERIIYCYVFNLVNQSVKKTTLFQTTIETKQPIFSGANKRQTSFAISPNGDYFAIATDNIKKNSNSYDIRVFDAHTLKLLYKKAYQEDKEKYYKHNDLIVNDDASVFALGKLYIDGRFETKGGDANYEFVLNKISETNSSSVAVQVDDIHIRTLRISELKNKLFLLGFYSENRTGRIKGGCSFTINSQNLTISASKLIELPAEVYEDLYGEKRAERKKGKELRNFYVDYVLFDNIGNTYLLAEEFYVTQHYVNNGMNGGYWTTTYHYDDLLILKFNAQGALEWGRSVFKRATAPSYNAFVKNNNLHVILNSGKKLVDKKDGRTKVSKGFLESSALYDIVFNQSGEVSYDKIQNNKGNTEYTPFYGTYENDKFIMISKRGGKKNKFMILQ